MTPEQEERLVAALELIAIKMLYQNIYGIPAQPQVPHSYPQPHPIYSTPWSPTFCGEVVEINTAAALTK